MYHLKVLRQYNIILRCFSLNSEEVGTDHVSDHALRFSSDVSMERMYRLSFCRNSETLHPGVGLNGKSSCENKLVRDCRFCSQSDERQPLIFR